VILVFLNENAARRSSSTFDIGGAASVAARPIGRNASAETNYRPQSEMYSYSKSKGVFAGVSLSGTRWAIEGKANQLAYRSHGSDAPRVDVLLTTPAGADVPTLFQSFLASLARDVGPGTVTRTAATK
jgi:lipid-binding SYLF domain-containing protein